MMTNWAVHQIDIILWAMRAQSPRKVVHTGGKFIVDDMSDTPDTIQASWQFDDFTMQYEYRGFNNFHEVFPRPNHHGICFHGSNATMVLDRSGYAIYDNDNPAQPVETAPRSEQDGPWQRGFVDCIKENRKPPLDLEMSHRATVCCHLANISYHTSSMIYWDGQNEEILNNTQAAELLDYERRLKYQLPKV
ncbi:MAG: hypothetical protein ACOX5R_01290 [bacterium]|jgi:predicted dehydrogenase